MAGSVIWRGWRVIRPVPTVVSTFLVFDHHRPPGERRAFFRRIGKHFFDDDRTVADLALPVPNFQPVPNLGRVEDLHGIMRAEGSAVDERPRVAYAIIR